ncbi:ankyrin-1-like [Stegodyphus dumicola]|uniref:ankyrin-1-like n=1 Tax=Stegodyphus dumicola TaxID=202533 RepID=UPI0015B1A76A|nr:ankyrin-1-like [Stegodyphus dumicola]
MVSRNHQHWDKKLDMFLLAFRSAVLETIGYFPCLMLFGRDLRLPCDLLLGRTLDASSSSEEYILKHCLKRCTILQETTENMKTRYDTRATGHRFNEEDKVWLWIEFDGNESLRSYSHLGIIPYTSLNRLNRSSLNRLNNVVVRILDWHYCVNGKTAYRIDFRQNGQTIFRRKLIASSTTLSFSLVLHQLRASFFSLKRELAKRFVEAVKTNDVNTVKQVLNEGLNSDYRFAKGGTLLTLSIYYRRPEIAKVLLSAGADVDAENQYRESPLYLAAEIPDVELIKLLLDHGAKVTIRDGNSPLHQACSKSCSEGAKLLIEKSSDDILKLCDISGDNPLRLACSTCTPDVVELLMARDNHPNTTCLLGNGVLLGALRNTVDNALPIVSMLLDAGATVRERNFWGLTPWFSAVEKSIWQLKKEETRKIEEEDCGKPSYVDLCMLLLKHGCDINDTYERDRTALHMAVIANHERLVRKLLISGSNMDIRDQDGLAPLFYACQNGNRRIVDLLVSCGANLSDQNWHVWETKLSIRQKGSTSLEESMSILNELKLRSRECLPLQMLCNIAIRKTLKNVEEDAPRLPLSKSMIKRIQLKDTLM